MYLNFLGGLGILGGLVRRQSTLIESVLYAPIGCYNEYGRYLSEVGPNIS